MKNHTLALVLAALVGCSKPASTGGGFGPTATTESSWTAHYTNYGKYLYRAPEGATSAWVHLKGSRDGASAWVEYPIRTLGTNCWEIVNGTEDDGRTKFGNLLWVMPGDQQNGSPGEVIVIAR